MFIALLDLLCDYVFYKLLRSTVSYKRPSSEHLDGVPLFRGIYLSWTPRMSPPGENLDDCVAHCSSENVVYARDLVTRYERSRGIRSPADLVRLNMHIDVLRRVLNSEVPICHTHRHQIQQTLAYLEQLKLRIVSTPHVFG